jgi:hypothetical protein
MTMTRVLSTIVIAASCLAGCQSSEPETPIQAIGAIIQLHEARDFDSLVRTRYAEIWKAESEQQIQSLVDRFKTRYQDDDTLEQAISIYRSALQIAPELAEDGTVATFELNNGFIKLSQMPDGTWGFHL